MTKLSLLLLGPSRCGLSPNCHRPMDGCRSPSGGEPAIALTRAAHLKRYVCAVAMQVILALPCLLQAQEPARLLEELKARAKIGENLLVTDDSGREVKGRLLDLSADTLTLGPGGVPRMFAEHNIRLVRRPDTIWLGFGIGAAIGAGLAIWDYSIDPSEPANAMFSVILIGGGAAIGAGIDAMTGGPKTLFAAPPADRRRATLCFAPILSAGRQSIAVSLRF